mgnify:CR=1 FL=1
MCVCVSIILIQRFFFYFVIQKGQIIFITEKLGSSTIDGNTLTNIIIEFFIERWRRCSTRNSNEKKIDKTLRKKYKVLSQDGYNQTKPDDQPNLTKL